MILSLTEAFTYPSIPNNAAKPKPPARKIKIKALPIPDFFSNPMASLLLLLLSYVLPVIPAKVSLLFYIHFYRISIEKYRQYLLTVL